MLLIFKCIYCRQVVTIPPDTGLGFSRLSLNAEVPEDASGAEEVIT